MGGNSVDCERANLQLADPVGALAHTYLCKTNDLRGPDGSATTFQASNQRRRRPGAEPHKLRRDALLRRVLPHSSSCYWRVLVRALLYAPEFKMFQVYTFKHIRPSIQSRETL